MPDTPREPKLSTLPNPMGNRSVGGFKLHETVAKVRISEARSAILCHASAVIDLELNAHPPMNLAIAIPKLDIKPIRVMRTPGSFLLADVRYVLS